MDGFRGGRQREVKKPPPILMVGGHTTPVNQGGVGGYPVRSLTFSNFSGAIRKLVSEIFVLIRLCAECILFDFAYNLNLPAITFLTDKSSPYPNHVSKSLTCRVGGESLNTGLLTGGMDCGQSIFFEKKNCM